MTLPSPCFVKNSIKPIITTTHVKKDESKKANNFVAYCKYCSEGFKSENELFQHRRAHERCPYEGCQFNASAKIISSHIERVHLKSNTLVKIQDLTTPEQIEKWKEERRKRYPTTANVLLRQQAQEIRFQRGEKLQDRQQRFGNFQQRDHIKNLDNRHYQKSNRGRQGRNQQTRRYEWRQDLETTPANVAKLDLEPTQESSLIKENTVITVKPRELSRSIAVHKAVQFHDDDLSEDEKRATPRFKGTSEMKDYHEVETIIKEKAALSILGMYGSDSDSANEEDAEPVEEPAKPISPQTIDIIEDNEEEVAEDEDNCEAPDEVPIVHNSEMMPPDLNDSVTTDKISRKRKHSQQQSRRVVRPKSTCALDYSKLRHQPSVNPFLEKLLQQDIRHERNVLLQCVNYVVKNNFFDVAQPVSIPAETKNAQEQENVDSQTKALE